MWGCFLLLIANLSFNKKIYTMKKFYFVTLLTFATVFAAMAQPATGAATPPVRNATDFVSIYGNSYGNVDSTDFYPNWGQTNPY